MNGQPQASRDIDGLQRQVEDLQTLLLQTEAERAELIRRRRRQLLLIGASLSLLVHIGLMIVLSSVYRARRGAPTPQAVPLEFAIVQEEELTEFQTTELDDLVPEVISELEDVPEMTAASELEADAPAAELEVARAGSVPRLGGSGDGTGTGPSLEGGGAGTSFFGISSRGNRFAYIVDRSGSMSFNRKIEVARRELARSVDGLPDYAFFSAYLFSTDFREPPMQRGWTRATKNNVNRFIRWLQQVDPGGGTNPLSAFMKVYSLEERPDVIFFLTDGEISGFNLEHVRALNSQGKRVVINTIAFGDPSSQELLKAIAAETGGMYRFVASGGVN